MEFTESLLINETSSRVVPSALLVCKIPFSKFIWSLLISNCVLPTISWLWQLHLLYEFFQIFWKWHLLFMSCFCYYPHFWHHCADWMAGCLINGREWRTAGSPRPAVSPWTTCRGIRKWCILCNCWLISCPTMSLRLSMSTPTVSCCPTQRYVVRYPWTTTWAIRACISAMGLC